MRSLAVWRRTQINSPSTSSETPLVVPRSTLQAALWRSTGRLRGLGLLHALLCICACVCVFGVVRLHQRPLLPEKPPLRALSNRERVSIDEDGAVTRNGEVDSVEGEDLEHVSEQDLIDAAPVVEDLEEWEGPLLQQASSYWSPQLPNGTSLIGDEVVTRKQCRRSICTLCSEMKLYNLDSVIPPYVKEYLQRHVMISVVTGSFDGFFRMDLALCTWLSHVPDGRLHVFTDKANASSGRYGTWHEAELPRSLKFTKQQLQARGYTIDWIRAQYRFIQAFQEMTNATLSNRGGGGDGLSSGEGDGTHSDVEDIRWVIVVDDDTFVNIVALTHMLMSYDARELIRINKLPKGTKTSRETWSRIDALVKEHKHQFRPLYLNEGGWGGAGHIMNFAALPIFQAKSTPVCVNHYMVRKGFASDVTLKKCAPVMGIQSVSESLLSHCQANFLRSRLTSGQHVSSHVKRDVVPPRLLAMWRMRLYYQVVYHRNYTVAYPLLLRVGACAYGSSCKLNRCDEAHDREALSFFQLHSGNGSVVPLL